MKKIGLQLNIGQSVLYSGATSYSYWVGDEHKNLAYRQKATVVNVTENSVLLKMDYQKQRYRSVSQIPECDGIDMLPMEHVAVVCLSDIVCGDKVIEVA